MRGKWGSDPPIKTLHFVLYSWSSYFFELRKYFFELREYQKITKIQNVS